MGFIHVTVVGPDETPVLAAVREFGAEKVILVGATEEREQATRVAAILRPLGIETTWRAVEGDPLLGMIRLFQEIAAEHDKRLDDILVNLGAASRGAACAALSAAFVAGLKAVDRAGDKTVFLPVLRFSYTEVVSDAKVAVLRALDEMGGEVTRLRDLADAAGLQDSLASYHIRGGRDGKGLIELGLVKVERGPRGALTIRLTPMGELLARGLLA